MSGAAGAFAQGTLDWEDSQPGYYINIFSPNLGNPLLEETGNTHWDAPQGDATYTGGWIGNYTGASLPGVGATPSDGFLGINYQNAANFRIGLYLDTSPNALLNDILTSTPLATTTIESGADEGYNNADANGGRLTYVSGFAPGTQVFVGLAAWYSGGGANSYASAVAQDTVEGYVESTTSVALAGGSSPLATLAGLGLTSFSLADSVPEPSTIALGLLGASAFLMRFCPRSKN